MGGGDPAFWPAGAWSGTSLASTLAKVLWKARTVPPRLTSHAGSLALAATSLPTNAFSRPRRPQALPFGIGRKVLSHNDAGRRPASLIPRVGGARRGQPRFMNREPR